MESELNIHCESGRAWPLILRAGWESKLAGPGLACAPNPSRPGRISLSAVVVAPTNHSKKYLHYIKAHFPGAFLPLSRTTSWESESKSSQIRHFPGS